jgi:hypothetical protein
MAKVVIDKPPSTMPIDDRPLLEQIRRWRPGYRTKCAFLRIHARAVIGELTQRAPAIILIYVCYS